MEQIISNMRAGYISEFYIRMNIAILSGNNELVGKRASKDKIVSCMNDLEINVINKIKNGDINSFEQLIEKYKDKAFSLSLRILKNREDAEDSLQEAFIKAFRAILNNQFEERSMFSTYLYRIVYNTALDFYKRHKSRNYNLIFIDEKNLQDENDDGDFAGFELKIDKERFRSPGAFKTDKRVLDNELQNLVNNFLSEIPEKYSVILTLFYINDLSHEEISEVLRVPLGTVKNRIFRAKEKLKEIITKTYTGQSIIELIEFI
jgi:RNA polymerase sigma-70 factor (ECF subfamily)